MSQLLKSDQSVVSGLSRTQWIDSGVPILNRKHLMRFTHHRTAVALAALALGGCASLAPPFEPPALPVAARFETPATELGGNAAQVAWREYFTDPQMQRVIALALANNRDVRSAVLRVQEARAAYAIGLSDRWPTVAAQGGAERTRVPSGLSPSGQAITSNQFSAGVGLASWEIDFWGAVRSRNDAALQSYLATDAARRAATLGLIAQVAEVTIGLHELDERIDLARQTITSRAESVRIFTRRVELGAAARLTLLQYESLLTQAKALGAQLEQARAAQQHALTLLVGAPVALERRDTALGAATDAAQLRAGLPSDLLLNRPDILAAEHQLRAANANIGAARAAYFPRIALTGSLSSASTDLGDLFSSGSQGWSFGPSLSVPIFDSGRRDANLEVTQVRRELAVTHYEKAVQSAFRDVADALSAQRWLTEQQAIAETSLATQTERARLSQLRFDAGSSAFLDVLDAERDLLAAQQQLVQARRALLSNRVSLYAALGGGSLTLGDVPTQRASTQP